MQSAPRCDSPMAISARCSSNGRCSSNNSGSSSVSRYSHVSCCPGGSMSSTMSSTHTEQHSVAQHTHRASDLSENSEHRQRPKKTTTGRARRSRVFICFIVPIFCISVYSTAPLSPRSSSCGTCAHMDWPVHPRAIPMWSHLWSARVHSPPSSLESFVPGSS